MRLLDVRVQNYKSIEDSDTFRVDDLTCLVGKNESGKTTVLKALHRLNPDDPSEAKFDAEIEYPRHRVFDYQARAAEQPDTVVTTTWELSDEEADWIQQTFGEGALTGRQATFTKKYNNIVYRVVPIDEKLAVANLIADSGLDAQDQKKLTSITSASDLVTQVQGLEESTRRDSFLERLGNVVGEGTAVLAVASYLRKRMPKFVYYASYHALPGQMPLEQFVQLEEAGELSFGEKIFKNLLALVGVTPSQVAETETYEALKAKLEAIGIKLSNEIFEYWSQNRDLQVEFSFDMARPGDPPPYDHGYIFRTRIKNTRHGVSVSFDERSTGFVWFFSFLVWFSQMQREHGDNLVLLLDEPGLSLHGTAQADLLRYINEKLVPNYQVIYTTHSPFMIDSQELLSVRTVEDVVDGTEVLGTKVGDKVLSTDAETLFPLRAALGYDITQTLFVGDHTLLVEGPSDLLYLKWASDELRERGRTSLDRRWTVTPCGGLTKVNSFLSLFGAQGLQVAVLADWSEGDKATVRSLRERSLLRDGRILTADMLLDGRKEADVEDLLGRRFYIELVNRAYSLGTGNKLKTTKAKDAPERVVKEVESHFKTLPSSVPEFDHYTPAEYLVLNRGNLTGVPGLDAALDVFEALFVQLNAFLDETE
jgi:predicted ATP-dependent endonuclease of OLD family